MRSDICSFPRAGYEASWKKRQALTNEDAYKAPEVGKTYGTTGYAGKTVVRVFEDNGMVMVEYTTKAGKKDIESVVLFNRWLKVLKLRGCLRV